VERASTNLGSSKKWPKEITPPKDNLLDGDATTNPCPHPPWRLSALGVYRSESSPCGCLCMGAQGA
jgi:hypothetical protein